MQRSDRRVEALAIDADDGEWNGGVRIEALPRLARCREKMSESMAMIGGANLRR